MTIEQHLVVLSVMAAPGRAVGRDVLLYEHGEEATRLALWHGPLHERWVFSDDGRRPCHVQVYYAGPEATTDRPWGVFESGPREVYSL